MGLLDEVDGQGRVCGDSQVVDHARYSDEVRIAQDALDLVDDRASVDDVETCVEELSKYHIGGLASRAGYAGNGDALA